MVYWLTTHWPQRVNEPAETPPFGVWVVDGKRQVIERVAPGDLVFFYESRWGRTLVEQRADGSERRVPCREGRMGIVSVGRVTELAYQPDNSSPQEYTDGTKLWWRYCAPTETLSTAGFIPPKDVARILGYADNYMFRGLGEQHSGLRRLSETEYQSLWAAFSRNAAEREAIRQLEAQKPAWGGPGGEGPEHRELKERIAADPELMLGESGLKLWRVEWSLPTGDRIDVILKDSFDRFVVVEVEVDCKNDEIVGPLQCMKYRAMLSYIFGRRPEEVRCILVAHSIHSDVESRCEAHGISTFVSPRSPIV